LWYRSLCSSETLFEFSGALYDPAQVYVSAQAVAMTEQETLEESVAMIKEENRLANAN